MLLCPPPILLLANQIAARLRERAEEVVFSEYTKSAYAPANPEVTNSGRPMTGGLFRGLGSSPAIYPSTEGNDYLEPC